MSGTERKKERVPPRWSTEDLSREHYKFNDCHLDCGQIYIGKIQSDLLRTKKRVERIELSTKAWEASILPLNYTRVTSTNYSA